ncbi:hypothetical protein IMG5_033550 [Ichthyophthirius multifiliis]|uniref:Uncharacterized protein n=1 Tax=Ichthyophthirius multifiliis TaxID=5932 RepID=G0QLN0_ICHMU|nr:hypothetical protein IMG5_033550 [Ichthyophthirius multifiliis]EGR33876.1 hypothetical protein IMG5_033550 [Ichthyophthirius multifiliis]|eukprot:XP_004039100.1 hypothetical protein IMG5_033550 [Ichthyophthirius multifiliis]
MELAGLDDALMNGKVSQLTKVFKTILPEDDKDTEQMSQEELKLIHLLTRVGDVNRLLKKLPTNSPIYYQKQQEVNYLNKLKDDLEKIIQEQRYQKLREDYNASGKADPEKERQIKTRSQLIQKLNNLHQARKYMPMEGFTIFWDWAVNVPKRYSSVKVQWGLFKRSEVIVPPQFLEHRPLQMQSFNTKYAVWGDRDHVYDIKGNKDILLVVELQCFYLDYGQKTQMDVYGWSILELFDMNQDLMRGKWKIPFYSTKINPNVLVSQSKNLQSQSNTMLHLRICFPQDLEFGDEYPLHPWTQGNEFFIPVIHKKTVVQASIELDLTKQRQTSTIFNDQQDSSSESESDEEPKQEFTQMKMEPSKNEQQINNNRNENKGLHITIHNLLKYLTDKCSKIKCFLIDVKRGTIKDDFGRDCQFETDVYEPLRPSKENSNNFAQLLDSKLIEEGITVMQEDYHFFVDITSYAYILIGKAWYAFSLFEKEVCQIGHYYKNMYDVPIVKPPFDASSVNYFKNSEIDFSINYFDFDKDNKKSQDEKYADIRDLKAKLRKKPQVKSVKVRIKEDLDDLSKAFLENTQVQYLDKPFEKGQGIDFYIDAARFLPDNVTVSKISLSILNQNFDKFFDNDSALPDLNSDIYSPKYGFRKELRATHFDPTLQAFMVIETIDNMNKEVRIVGYSIINFFLNSKTKKQPTDQLDNEIILQNGNYQIPIFCQHPVKIKPFNIERLYQLDKLPCASLLVRIVNAPISADGFRALSLEDVPQQDWERIGLKVPQPPYSIEKQAFYNTSYYSLRDSEKELFIIRLRRISPKTLEALNDLMNHFAKKDFVQKQEELIKQTNSQKKKKKKKGQVEEEIQEQPSEFNPINIKEIKVKDAKEWIDKNIVRSPYTDIIELQYFAQYKPDVGFKFSLDGFHNNPHKDYPIVGLYCLNPPATFYLGGGYKRDEIMLNSAYNWQSPITSPQFTEGYFTFTGVEFQQNLSIIIDCRKVIFNKKGDQVYLENIGWTLCPVFTNNGYVKSGIYQLPIFKGQVPFDILQKASQQNPWMAIQEGIKNKKNSVKYYETMSCIVRILDAQRDGHYQIPFDYTRVNYNYLPKDKIGDYAYNSAIDIKLKKATKMLSMAHNKAKVNEYQDKLTNLTLQTLKIY